MRKLLSGNEAVARGAYEAGVQIAAAYPGTPSTEILENLALHDQVYSEWSPNEKVAMDVVIGAAYAGRRAMTVMKHVGLNVAADPFFYASMTGVQAGLVIVSADDPDMHSSQNEQDNRNFARFARVPCLEPSDSQEAKDLVGVALDLSEEFDTPVMLRLTTRISHSHTLVELGERQAQAITTPLDYHVDCVKYVTVPAHARQRHRIIEERIVKLTEFAETFAHNRVEMGDPALGIVSAGVAYMHAREVFPQASFLKLGMTYPLPEQLIRDFASRVERLLVIEELDPFIEEKIRLLGIPVEGKSLFPVCGEFNPSLVRQRASQAGLMPAVQFRSASVPKLPARPPLLCPGCPHRGVFAVASKLKLLVHGDIGCYTLGFLPPLSALHTCGCMGASVGVAHGVRKAGITQKNVAVIGDSTFFHTGIQPLLNVVYNQSDTIVIILDNRTTAMTGHQPHPGTGTTLMGQPTHAVDFEELVRGLGVRRVHCVDPYQLAEVEAALRDCLDAHEPAVIVSQRACALLPDVKGEWMALKVDPERCNGCGLCFRLGCPAVVRADDLDPKSGRPKACIDSLLCTGCEMCAQSCARQAILTRSEMTREEVEEA